MPLSTLWKVFFYGWFASEVYIAIVTRTRRGAGKIRDRGTLLLLWVVIFSAFTCGIWISETQGPNLPSGPIIFGASWLGFASLLVLVIGLVLRWVAVVSLGKSFSSNVAIHSTQKVLKTGLYYWMRHPSYTGLLLCIVAVGLHQRNWISLLVIFVPPAAALLYRIHVEELALREHFGQEYVDY